MELCEGLSHLSSFITMLLTNYQKVSHFTYSYCTHTSLEVSSTLKISGQTYKMVKAERNTDWQIRQASTLQNTPHKIMWYGNSLLGLYAFILCVNKSRLLEAPVIEICMAVTELVWPNGKNEVFIDLWTFGFLIFRNSFVEPVQKPTNSSLINCSKLKKK